MSGTSRPWELSLSISYTEGGHDGVTLGGGDGDLNDPDEAIRVYRAWLASHEACTPVKVELVRIVDGGGSKVIRNLDWLMAGSVGEAAK